VILDLVGELAYVDISGMTIADRHFTGPGVMMQATIMSHDEMSRTVTVELSLETRPEVVVPIDRLHEPNITSLT
jgi:hypothetical protein